MGGPPKGPPLPIRFHGLPTAIVDAIRTTGRDAYGLPVEHHVSDGDGIPCRHSLTMIPKAKGYPTLAHRPFEGLDPYTETGPIFLSAEPSTAHVPSAKLPGILNSPTYILRGYSLDERIVYGTGAVTPRDQIRSRAATLLDCPEVAFVHVRSATNDCYQCRIDRA